MRRHGWQLPLHPLQIVAMAVFILLVVPFYIFLGRFLGVRIVKNTVVTVFSFVAISVALLFIRCTVIDPSDRTSIKKKKATKKGLLSKLNYRSILCQIIKRFIKKMERRISKYLIRRTYFSTRDRNSLQFQPFLPFPLVVANDAATPNVKDEEFSYCPSCDLEVKISSKHCRSCDRCVEGFDHHCRWLNNCIGKRNYTTFIILMVFVLLLLIIEGAAAVATLIRCLADKRGVVHELHSKLHKNFPTGVLIGISVFLALLSAYSLAALGQLFFFHLVLIRKGMRTYDYIVAMKEEREAMDPFAGLDSDSDLDSDYSTEFDSPQKCSSLPRLFCRNSQDEINQETRRLSIKIDPKSTTPKKPHFQVDPWKLLKMSKEKALQAVEKAKERIIREKQFNASDQEILKPLPLEVKHGPLVVSEKRSKLTVLAEMTSTAVTSRGWFPGSPALHFPSPRRRFSWSSSPRPQRYRSNFDLKLTQISKELESHISGHVLHSILKEGRKDEERSPSS